MPSTPTSRKTPCTPTTPAGGNHGTRLGAMLAAAGLAFATSAGVAGIVGGDATVIAPPAETGFNSQQDNRLLAFAERQGVTLAKALVVDRGSIAAGTVVNSTMLVFDPKSSAAFKGVVRFDGAILGIIGHTDRLRMSDEAVGLSSVRYLSPFARGVESHDAYRLVDAHTIEVDLRASTPGDHLRIITAATAVPAPGAAGAVLGAMVLAGRRRR